jgi:hypothetical protein
MYRKKTAIIINKKMKTTSQKQPYELAKKLITGLLASTVASTVFYFLFCIF